MAYDECGRRCRYAREAARGYKRVVHAAAYATIGRRFVTSDSASYFITGSRRYYERVIGA